MRKRIQLETDNTRRRIRDIIQKADQKRRDETFFQPGGSYVGGSSESDYGGYLPGDSYFGDIDPPCYPLQQVVDLLEDNGDGTFSVPEGYALNEAYFDGVSAMGKYDIDSTGNVVPHATLDPETIISGLLAPQ